VNIIGISAYYHDSAAALVCDGKIVAAAQEERFTRKKFDASFPANAVKFCLDYGGLELDEIDTVIFYDKPFLKFERLLETYYNYVPSGISSFVTSMPVWSQEKLFLKNLIIRELNKSGTFIPDKQKLLFSAHHLSHAASAFYPSPFEEAVIVTIDGVGEWSTASICLGKGNSIKLIKELRFPHSVGLLYSSFTYFLGFRVNSGEYKLMGLAPYADPGSDAVKRYVSYIKENLAEIRDDGSIWLNQTYFSYATGLHMIPEKKWERLFGFRRRMPEDIIGQDHCDLAQAIQVVTEEIVKKMVRHAQTFAESDLQSGNLCMAGGVALNSVANGRLVRETPFKEVFIQPAAGDAGGALGAALYAHHVLFQKPRRFVMEHCFWGASYTQDQALAAVKRSGLPFTILDGEEQLVDTAVRDLSAGRVVGWFHGAFEWGPRALGNRSILADPRRAGMKDIVNSKIKFREAFRPFAPAIPSDRVGEFFEGAQGPEVQQLARFMLLVLPWKPGKGELVQAVNHMGTGRVQAVCQTSNSLFFKLLRRFGDQTGIPVLLNTSFNLRGEPIVSSPEDALRSFQASGIDTMMLDRIWVRKA